MLPQKMPKSATLKRNKLVLSSLLKCCFLSVPLLLILLQLLCLNEPSSAAPVKQRAGRFRQSMKRQNINKFNLLNGVLPSNSIFLPIMKDKKNAKKKKCCLIGHRGSGCSTAGAPSRYPENSFFSIQEAINRGSCAVEIDVLLTKDNVVIVAHGDEDNRGIFLDQTVVNHLSDSRKIYPEELTLSELKKFKLKDAWINSIRSKYSNDEFFNDKDIISSFIAKSPEEKQVVIDEYMNFKKSVKDMHISDYQELKIRDLINENIFEFLTSVPTLEEILKYFHKEVEFYVELKGRNPLIGEMVLKSAKMYPGVIKVISSFEWFAPIPLDFIVVFPKEDFINAEASTSSDARSRNIENLCTVRNSFYSRNRNICPNGRVVVDLLYPLINNELNITIALLFNKEDNYLPSGDHLLRCLDKYNSSVAHVYQEFSKTEDAFVLSAKTVSMMVDEKGKKVVKNQQTPQEDGREVSPRRQVGKLAKFLHLYNKKVLTYFGCVGYDRLYEFFVSAINLVDEVCTNNVALGRTLF